MLDGLGRAGDDGALAHYADPAYYRKTYARREDDVAWYLKLGSRFGGSILEYGAGNGRISLQLARAGHEIVAVDLSRPMLSDFERALALELPAVRRRVKLQHGDMRKLSLRRRFGLVIAPFNVVLHLYEREDVEAFLARVRAHLGPGGVLAFDFSIPQPRELIRPSDRKYSAPRFRHPTLNRLTRYTERFEYDPLRQTLLVEMEMTPEGGEPWSMPLTHRQFFPREMEALLHYNGFEVLEWVADFGKGTLDETTDSLGVVAAPRPNPKLPLRG